MKPSECTPKNVNLLNNYEDIHDHVKDLVSKVHRRKALSGLRKYTTIRKDVAKTAVED